MQGTILLLIMSGCVTRTPYNEKYVSDNIEKRSGFGFPAEFSDSISFPPGVLFEDSITEEESVAIALWNNPQLQVDLAVLGFARADLIEAGMINNPAFSLLFPLGPKQLEFTLSYAIDMLWQRPFRVASAKLNSEKVAENLIQNGLALVRDVYISFANLNKTQEQLKILEDEVTLDTEIAEIASARRLIGDISELEETAFYLATSRTRENVLQARRDAEIQKIRFLALLGLISEHTDIQIAPGPFQLSEMPEPEEIIKTALACRPDIRAAELEIEIAGKQLGWEKSKIFNLSAMLDANAEGKQGFEMGPGGQITIPLFYFNQGGTERARTEIERAANHYLVIQQSIRKEILEAYQGYLAARSTYEMLNNEILPKAKSAVDNGESAYLAGEISYLEFLEYKRQFMNARLRFIAAEADTRINMANLYYSIGWKTIPF